MSRRTDVEDERAGLVDLILGIYEFDAENKDTTKDVRARPYLNLVAGWLLAASGIASPLAASDAVVVTHDTAQHNTAQHSTTQQGTAHNTSEQHGARNHSTLQRMRARVLHIRIDVPSTPRGSLVGDLAEAAAAAAAAGEVAEGEVVAKEKGAREKEWRRSDKGA
eukprot:2445474-Rhodomonas_salina.8